MTLPQLQNMISMKIYGLISLFIIASFMGSMAQNYPNQQLQDSLMKLDIQSIIENYDIPGAAVAVIYKDSIWTGTYGFADKGENTPLSRQTVFRLGSISKTFVAIAIMQMVQEGKIALDTPVHKIIPEIEMNNKWEKENPVRLIHLLEHTSSIDDVHFNEGYNTSGDQNLPLSDIFNINPKSRYVRWKPGEYASYSNDAYSLLGLIIEKISGQKFEQYIQNNILDKLGPTSFSYWRDEKNSAQFARGCTSEGMPLEYVPVLMRPSGGINSNITDMAVFVQMLLNGGTYKHNTIIDSISLNRMFVPSSSIAAREGFKPGYGSGFSSRFVNGHKFFGHGGGLPDFSSMFLIDPASDLGIVVLINAKSDYFNYLIEDIVRSVDFVLKPQKETSGYPISEIDTEDIAAYYSQANYGISLDRFPNYFLSGLEVISENDSLYIKEFMGEKKALIHRSGNEYLRDSGAKESVYFFKNSEGEIMLTVLGKEFYKKDQKWKPILDRTVLISGLATALLYALFIIIWLIYLLGMKLIKKRTLKISYLPRLYLSLPVLSVFALFISLAVWHADYNNYGAVSLAGILIFLFSVLFPLLSIGGIWITFFRNSNKSLLEKICLRTVSVILLCLSLVLIKYEFFALMVWTY